MVDDAGVPTLVLDTNPTASGGANDMVHITGDDAGYYDLELAAANVNYLGRAKLALTDAANHCPVFHEFMILPAMIYDSLVLGTDRLDANVTHVADTAQTARDIGAAVPAAVPGAAGGLFIAGTNAATTVTTSFTTTFTGNLTGSVASVTGAVGSVTGAVGSVTGAVGSVTGAVGSVTTISSGAITEASFATTAGSFKPLGIVRQGTAQSATATTLVLDAASSFADNELVGCVAWVPGQSPREITANVGATKTATIDPAWTTPPAGTPYFYIFAGPPALTALTQVNATQIEGADATDAIQAAANAALVANHLDHLLAADYDPASKPGVATALLNELIGNDAGVSQFTANSLELAPSGGGGVADWTADERTAIRSILGIPGSGTTPADPSVGILDAIRDSVATRASQASVDDLPTNAELATALAAADDAVLAAIAAVQADLPQRITKNVALANFPFLMVLASDHATGATGLTVTATRSIDGAAFAACANAVVEVANGMYKIDLAATDLNGNTITLKFTAATADTRFITIVTQPT